jgi:hypothetical protein
MPPAYQTFTSAAPKLVLELLILKYSTVLDLVVHRLQIQTSVQCNNHNIYNKILLDSLNYSSKYIAIFVIAKYGEHILHSHS